jgi:hypothetical protein
MSMVRPFKAMKKTPNTANATWALSGMPLKRSRGMLLKANAARPVFTL